MKNPFSALGAAALQLLRPPAPTLASLDPGERLDGRTALITGANRGLGRAVALELARRGANLILAGRSGIPEAGDEIARASGSRTVAMRPLDLADLRSPPALARSLAEDGVALDLLILNAGLIPRAARPTAQGFELMFGVHLLGNVTLVEELLAARVLAAAPAPRIVFVSSESHRGAGPIDFARLGAWEDYGALGGTRVYGYSKLLLTTYALDLARRLGPAASVFACCPGPVASDIAREAPAALKPLVDGFMRGFFPSPEIAAVPVATLAIARALDGTTGRYFHRLTERAPDPEALDADRGARLRQASHALIAKALGAPFPPSAQGA